MSRIKGELFLRGLPTCGVKTGLFFFTSACDNTCQFMIIMPGVRVSKADRESSTPTNNCLPWKLIELEAIAEF